MIDGDQLVFGRIRIRIDTPNAGTYRVVHPYGEDTLAAARDVLEKVLGRSVFPRPW